MEKKPLYLHREKAGARGRVAALPLLGVYLVTRIVTVTPPILKVTSTFTLTESFIGRLFRFSYSFRFSESPLCPPEHDTKIRKMFVTASNNKKKIILLFEKKSLKISRV